MIRALTAAQTRLAEERAVAEGAVTLAELMRRAGEALAAEVAERAHGGSIAVLTGAGNNGGDGWVAARALHMQGRDVRVFAATAPETLTGIAAEAARQAIADGVAWSCPADRHALSDGLADCGVVVDALLGIGISGPVRPDLVPWVIAVNDATALVISADVPSGVDAQSGTIEGVGVEADVTVTFSAPKVGLVQFPGAAAAGEVVLSDVGLPERFLTFDDAPEIWSPDEYRASLPLPAADAHKNARGRVLVIAGSRAYPGAAVLAVLGAQRMGAGYVTLATPESVVPTAHAHLISAVVAGMPEDPSRSFSSRAVDRVLELASDHDAVVIGPGLTMSRGAVVLVRALVERLEKPLVVDADALNALMDATGLLQRRALPTVITPHPGEAARLLGVTTGAVQAGRIAAARRLATGRVVCILKGAGTIVAAAGRTLINTSGTPALATAGTGDVLAGMVGTLLSQEVDGFTAAALGAYVHGRAGEAAARALTPICVRAEDVAGHVPEAVGDVLEGW